MDQDNYPFYIGKGKENRWRPSQHIHSNVKSHTTNKIKSIGIENIKVYFLHKELIEAEAFNWECYWIKYFGRIDIGTGQLTNHTDGGEGVSGNKYKMVDEHKRKISEALKGGKHTEEHKQRNSEAQSKYYKSHPNPFKGKNHTDEAKRKMSESSKGCRSPRKGVKLSEETKRKISKANKGKPSWNKGVKI